LIRVSAPRLRARFEFVVLAARDDHMRAQYLGELQGEDADAAGPKGQQRIARRDAGALETVPGRYRGAWKSGGSGKADIVRQARNCAGWDRDIIGQHAVHAAAEGGGERGLAHRPTGPVAHEVDRDAVAFAPVGHPGAHCGDFARSIR
jgi:hypothetical protein